MEIPNQNGFLVTKMRTLGGLRNQEIAEGLWQRLPCREAGRFLERAGHTESVVGKHIVIIGGRKGYATPVSEQLSIQ